MHIKTGHLTSVNIRHSGFMDVTDNSEQSNTTFGPDLSSLLQHRDESDDLWEHHSHTLELEKALIAASADLLPDRIFAIPELDDSLRRAKERELRLSLPPPPSSSSSSSEREFRCVRSSREGRDHATSDTPISSYMRTPSPSALRASSVPSSTPKSGAGGIFHRHTLRHKHKGMSLSTPDHGKVSLAFPSPTSSRSTRPPSTSESVSSLLATPTLVTTVTTKSKERLGIDTSAPPFTPFAKRLYSPRPYPSLFPTEGPSHPSTHLSGTKERSHSTTTPSALASDTGAALRRTMPLGASASLPRMRSSRGGDERQEEVEGEGKVALFSLSKPNSATSSCAISPPPPLPDAKARAHPSPRYRVDGEWERNPLPSSFPASYPTAFASPTASLSTSDEEKIWVHLCPWRSTTSREMLMHIFYPHGADEVKFARSHHVVHAFVLFRTEEMARMAMEKVVGQMPSWKAAGIRLTLVSSREVQTAATQEKQDPSYALHAALTAEPMDAREAATVLQEMPYLEGARHMSDAVLRADGPMLDRIHLTLSSLESTWESAYDFGTELHERLYLRLIESNSTFQSECCGAVLSHLYVCRLLPPNTDPFRFASNFLQRVDLRVPHVEGICLFAHFCSPLDFGLSKASFWAVVQEMACKLGESPTSKALLVHLQRYLRHCAQQDVALPSPSRQSQQERAPESSPLPQAESSPTTSPRSSRVGSIFSKGKIQEVVGVRTPPARTVVPTTTTTTTTPTTTAATTTAPTTTISSVTASSSSAANSSSRTSSNLSPSRGGYPLFPAPPHHPSPLAATSSRWITKSDSHPPSSGSRSRGSHHRHSSSGEEMSSHSPSHHTSTDSGKTSLSPYASPLIHHSQDSLLLSPAYPMVSQMSREEGTASGGRNSHAAGSFPMSVWSSSPSYSLSSCHSPSLSGSSSHSPHSLSPVLSGAPEVLLEEDAKYRTVYISHLPPGLAQNNFMLLLMQCGPVNKVRICAGKGYATLFSFVEMQTVYGANEVIKLSGINYFNFILRVQVAKNPIQDELQEDAQVNPITGEVIQPCLFGNSSTSLLNSISAGDFK